MEISIQLQKVNPLIHLPPAKHFYHQYSFEFSPFCMFFQSIQYRGLYPLNNAFHFLRLLVIPLDLSNHHKMCLLYTSDAADDLLCVDLGGRRIIKKKKK